jgi:dienelactone hydrolase
MAYLQPQTELPYCGGQWNSQRLLADLLQYYSVKNLPRSSLFNLLVLLTAVFSAKAQRYVEREVTIPWVLASPGGLDALLVYADLPGKHPLAVITHGSSRKPEENAQVTVWQELPQALWFARRGWIALVVVRRGYGVSGGEPDTRRGGRCPQTDYQEAGEYSAEDLRIAIDYARGLPQVDVARVVAIGVSTGGFAVVALTAKAPSGLVAAINFAGGRGSKADHDVCNPGDLVHAYRNFGKRSRTPMLWIYAQNDKFFWPELAQKFDAAFRAQGGQDHLVLAPPIGEDGHFLFRHITAWSSTVDNFLKGQNLETLADLLPEITPANVPPPAGLSEEGLHAFQSYLLLGPHKAFARAPHSFGLAVAQMTVGEAREKALEDCKHGTQHNETCKVVSVDNADVHQ